MTLIEGLFSCKPTHCLLRWLHEYFTDFTVNAFHKKLKSSKEICTLITISNCLIICFGFSNWCLPRLITSIWLNENCMYYCLYKLANIGKSNLKLNFQITPRQQWRSCHRINKKCFFEIKKQKQNKNVLFSFTISTFYSRATV